MTVDRTFKRRGQQYECVDRCGYERPAQFIWIYTLHSLCPDCGRRFSCTASKTQIDKGRLSQRCERCRDPGRPIDLPAVKSATAKPAFRAKASNRRRSIGPAAEPTPQVADGVSHETIASPAAAVSTPPVAHVSLNVPASAYGWAMSLLD
jgi:hypothetical protein